MKSLCDPARTDLPLQLQPPPPTPLLLTLNLRATATLVAAVTNAAASTSTASYPLPTRRLLPTTYCLLPTAYYLLTCTYCPMPLNVYLTCYLLSYLQSMVRFLPLKLVPTYFLPLTDCYILPTHHYLSHTTYSLLPTTCSSPTHHLLLPYYRPQQQHAMPSW